MKVLAFVLLATVTATAGAEPDPQPTEGKNPGDALALSLGITLGGGGMMLTGSWMHTNALVYTGALVTAVGQPCLGGGGDSSTTAAIGYMGTPCGVAFTVIGLGGLAFLGGSIYEIVTAPSAAHRYNREHGLEATVVPTGNGVALVGRF